ncbi:MULTISPECIES: ATP-binding cassette domain-containing protein, partial [Citrobacter]|uniref:ABC transporter ATP-binding protein n=1 Tax=Citrobacter braakii TaxID=57706 RepID=A0A1V8NRM7_CITBR
MKVLNHIYSLLEKKGKLYFWLTIALTISYSLTTTLSPLILANIVSNLEQSNPMNSYVIFIILYALVMLITKFCEIILNTAQGFLRVCLLKNISSSYLKMILTNPVESLKDKNGGYICQMLTQASNDIYTLVRNLSQGIASPLLQLIFVTIICLSSDYHFVAAIFILYMFLFFSINIILNNSISMLRLKMIDSTVDSYVTLSDSVQNIVAIKKNDCLSVIENRYNSFLKKEEDSQKNYWKKTFKLFSLNSLQSFILFILLFSYSVYGVVNGSISIASFILITSYINLFSAPVESMSNVISDVKQSYHNLSRFFKEYKNIETDNKKESIFFNDSPSICFKNLSFTYNSSAKLILNNLNTVFEAGKITAIRGDSGSGKTTIAQIITNYVTTYTGDVLLNNISIKDIPEKYLSDLIYHVTQDDFIFMDTLRFNLKVANSSATDEQMLKALELACIDKINGESVSLDMILQDSGDNISGGQKQRISLARLFLRKPKIIILDEATASLDIINKKIVLKNIRDTFPHATILNISHDSDIWDISDNIFEVK